jgi:uncharacterized delta-60 repeat protein
VRLPRPLFCLGLALVALAPLSASAAEGNPDPSLGGDGNVLTDFGGEDSALAVTVDPQGRTIAGGSGGLDDPARPFATTFSLARYLPDGSPDPSFGGDGRVQSDFGDTRAEVRSIRIDAVGRILAVGTTTSFDGIGSAVALARFLPDGSPDPSFGQGGQAETRLGLSGAADAVLAPDGAIVVAGSSQRAGALLPTLFRYLPDGTLDQSFGTGGVREVRMGGFSAFRAVALDGAGRIIAVGDSHSPGSKAGRFTAIRLLPNGATDASFGQKGRARILRGTPASGADVVSLGGGRMLLAGSCSCGRGALVVTELQRNGRASRRFGREGVMRVPVPGAEARAVVEEPGGRIVIGGEAKGGWLLAALTPDGTLDRAFAGDGVSVAPGLGGAEALAAAPNGAITAAGSASGPADTDFEVRRYLP